MVLRTDLTDNMSEVGLHPAQHNEINNHGLRVCDIVAEYGADPTGATDDTAKFAQAVTDLAAAGGGTIQLRANCLHTANIHLYGTTAYKSVSLRGYGFSSRIQGVSGAAKPVVQLDVSGWDSVSNISIWGTRPASSFATGSDAEVGLYVNANTLGSNSQWNAMISNIWIQNVRGHGYHCNAPGVMGDRIRTFWVGGRGMQIETSATDAYYSNCDINCLSNDYGIWAAGTQTQWVNCQVYAMGQTWNGTNIVWDNTNTTAVGWALGGYQDCWNCVSEDNPIGVVFQGNSSQFRGTSGGDRIPMQLVGGYHSNHAELNVRCNDRWVPTKGADLTNAVGSRVMLNIDWEGTSVGPNSVPNTTTAIKDLAGFKAFDRGSTFNGVYSGNDYTLNRSGGGAFYNSGGTITPDVKEGLTYYINGTTATTIAAMTHRSGLAWGQRVRFEFDPGAGGPPIVTWDASYHDAPQPRAVGKISVIEFVQQDPSFSLNLRYVDRTAPNFPYKTVRKTANYVLNQTSTTTWFDLDATTDLVLDAVPGDYILVGVNGTWNNEAPAAYLDVASIVSSAPVNYWGGAGGTTDTGIGSWQGISSTLSPIGGPITRAVVAGDLSGGQVTLRLRYRLGTASTNKTLLAATGGVLQFWAENKYQ